MYATSAGISAGMIVQCNYSFRVHFSLPRRERGLSIRLKIPPRDRGRSLIPDGEKNEQVVNKYMWHMDTIR
jgi:hypothetical protein